MAALEWVKALHVLSVIAWMAGMLYLPRLFVYHADAEKGSVQSETFKVMERRLYRGITTPAMLATWVFGLLARLRLRHRRFGAGLAVAQGGDGAAAERRSRLLRPAAARFRQ